MRKGYLVGSVRTCPLCGRRLGVKISPLSWEAACSRHGLLRSEWVER
ncbi:biotin synthase auxiliary protein BsaP [Corynebacterium coyleae]